MIDIKNINNSEPYALFLSLYNQALQNNERYIEAACISSLNEKNQEVESRYVNLKYIYDQEWIFFTNYDSQKAKDFEFHNQISVIFFWKSTNIQIRIKANIKKTNKSFSDKHFLKRQKEKNALAISSNQSKKIRSYEDVINNYEEVLNKKIHLNKRPNYWGGFSFTPYYFEFWEGNDNRINKRKVYILKNNSWDNFFLQP